MSKLFVYGTLKKGFRAHDMLQQWNAVYLGKAKTAPQYQLYKVNWFPGMVEDELQEGGVQGELYQITEDTFSALDRYEGVPSLFKRAQILLDNDEEVTAYIYNEEFVGLDKVENGEWLEGREDD